MAYRLKIEDMLVEGEVAREREVEFGERRTRPPPSISSDHDELGNFSSLT